jgi:hypothetical protein
MRSIYEERVTEARKIEGQLASGGDTIVTRKFGPVAKLLWPCKAAAQIAAIAGVEERTAKRWLAGEFEPPICVVLAVMDEIFRKQ